MKKPTRSNWTCCAFRSRKFPPRACSRTKKQAVEEEFNRASNAAKLLELSQAALDALSENENSLLTQAGAIGRTLQELQRVDAGAANLAEFHSQAVGALRELQSGLSRYAEKIAVDPARLAELEERLDLIHSLKRKYGGDPRRSHRLRRRGAERNCNRSKAAMPNWRGSMPNCKNWTPKSAQSRQNAVRRAAKKSFPTGQSRQQQLEDLGSSKANLTWRSSRVGRTPNRAHAEIAREDAGPPVHPVSMKSNFNSPPTPANRPGRCGPSPPPAKWRA